MYFFYLIVVFFVICEKFGEIPHDKKKITAPTFVHARLLVNLSADLRRYFVFLPDLFNEFSRLFVNDKRAVGVELKNACGDFFGNLAFNRVENRFCLIFSACEN